MAASTLGGWLAGLALSPITGGLSALRQSRMFHPRGLVCEAEVEAAAQTPVSRELAVRLAGPALLRWSSAWWKQGEATDVLGCALRFSSQPLRSEPHPGDQDLLLATIQRPWSMGAAPWTTDTHDFLANHYYGVSPFLVAGRRVEWRLTPELGAPPGQSRAERLERALHEGACLRLELADYAGWWRRPLDSSFESVVRVRLRRFLDLDQDALRFDPFRAGRGIEPVGFVHAMRRATYLTSQRARPRHARGQ
jgi:hypothetical protein